MSFWLSLLNDLSVSLFGSILSASFCNALAEPHNRRSFWSCMVLLILLQSGVYLRCDPAFLQRIYPFVVHVPLVIVLSFLTRKLLWPVVSVLTAYLCCQLRRWLALMATALLAGGDAMQDAVELLLTIPLLLFLLRVVAPSLRELSVCPVEKQLQFGLIPAVYYGFDYWTRIYTRLLQSGDPAVVEFMPFVCCAAYLAFVLYHSAKERAELQLQQAQKTLDLQLAQAVREINTLRESQALARQYRHDLRHHLQYLSSCIENGQTEQAQSYISGICKEIEAQKLRRYCENEAANLVLSSFAGRAEGAGIAFHVQGTLPAFLLISDSDLCVLLSNALENALHACQLFAAAGKEPGIEVRFYERDDRLFLQIVNPCAEEVRFENGLPVSERPGHGIGVQSICAIVQRYGGIYTFLVKDGRFILRLSL